MGPGGQTKFALPIARKLLHGTPTPRVAPRPRLRRLAALRYNGGRHDEAPAEGPRFRLEGWDGRSGHLIPVGIVVAGVALHLPFGAVPAVWAAIPVAGALLYTMGEPVLSGCSAKASSRLGLGRSGRAARRHARLGGHRRLKSEGGDVVAEGDLETTEDTLAIAPVFPGETRDYVLELTVASVPEAGKKKALNFPYTMRVGRSDVRGNLGTERIRRRFACAGGEEIRVLDHVYHHLRVALDPKRDKIRLASLVREPADAPSNPEELEKVTLQGPIHVRLTEAPIPRLLLYLVSGGILLLAAALEAF